MQWNLSTRIPALCLLAIVASATQSSASTHNEVATVQRTADTYAPYQTLTWLAGERPICIVTQYTSNMDAYAHIATENHQGYAHRHGYHYFAYRGRISGERFYDPKAPNRLYTDGLYWQKLAATQNVVRMQHPHGRHPLCRWVMWVDADVLFTHCDQPLEDIIKPWESHEINPEGLSKDVILSRDHFATFINSGVFFVKNTEAGHTFLNAVAESYPQYKHRELPEQEAIESYALQGGLDTPSQCTWEQVQPRLRPDIAVAPQRTFNAFLDPDNHVQDVHWQENDFIAHFAGLKRDVRVAHMGRMSAAFSCPLQ